jgi:2-aminoadipate transaminase
MLFDNILAERTRIMSASAIREILKVVGKPGMVSLAGGIPSPDSFPMAIMKELTERVITKYGPSAFQYDLTEGFLPLREALSGYLAKKGLTASADEIRVTSGSQGGLVELGMILITKGDAVAVEAPTYLGAISAFNPYEPRYLKIDTDDDGLIPESLEALLKKDTVKFIYLNPTFQNPTGRTLTLERRKAVAEIVRRFNVLLVEDDPYGDLRYRGNPLPPIKTMAPDHTVYLGTLSKVFAPGLRLGFFLAPEPIRRWMVLAKQGIDLHTSTFNQALAAEFIAGGYMEKHLPNILRIYKPQQEAMLGALDRYFPKSATWSRPEGGMFIWVECPLGMDAELVNERGLERNVAFVPGRFFYTQEGEGLNTMRLNYTMSDEPTLDRAVKTLSEVIREMLP